VWSLYAQLPAEVRAGLESGKATEIFTPPVWHSTLINKYILKASKSQSAAKWLKQIQQWTQKKEKVKYDKDTGDVKITVQDLRVGEPVVEDIEFSGLVEWLEDNEDISIRRDDIIRFLQANSFIGAIKERTQGNFAERNAEITAEEQHDRYSNDMEQEFIGFERAFGVTIPQANQDGIVMNVLDYENNSSVRTIIEQDTNARGGFIIAWPDNLEGLPANVFREYHDFIRSDHAEVYNIKDKATQDKVLKEQYSDTKDIVNWFEEFTREWLGEHLGDIYDRYEDEIEEDPGSQEVAIGPQILGVNKNYRKHIID